MTSRSTCGALFALLALAPTGTSLQTVAGGFDTTDLVNPLPVGSFGQQEARLSNGDVIAFDGQLVRRFASDGTELQTLFDVGSQVFASLVRINPSETTVVVGESTNGELFAIDIQNGGGSVLTTLDFNYDATFADDDTLFVSAASTNLSDNDLWRVDVSSGSLTLIASVPGPSGPIDLDAAGNLYYAYPADFGSMTPGTSDVVSFPKALFGQGVLDTTDAVLIVGGFDGAGSLVIDRDSDRIYLGENNFSLGVNRVRQLNRQSLSANDSPVLYETGAFTTVSVLDVAASSGGASLDPYQPALGDSLLIGATDFFSFDTRTLLEPLRASTTLSGAGVGGVGNVTFGVSDGPPNGITAIAFGPTANIGPDLPVLNFAPALFTVLDLGGLSFVSGPLGLDGNGALSLTFFNSGALNGLYTFQPLLFTATPDVAGSANAVNL